MKFTYTSGDTPLEGFTIKRAIGRGGFGEVYFGVSAHGKEVALKLIQSNLDIELRGIQQCLNLKHPNLVHIYDLRTDGHGDHWLVMEHVAGETLSSILARNPAGVSPPLAGQWFLGLAAAVHHLHDHGIVHRDLKPGNVFLENGLIKVGDYGLCKAIASSQYLKQTQSVGTVHYMAPEIATGNYRHLVDIYAAGIILYEILTGHVPFDGESAAEILFKHQTERPDLAKVPAAWVPVLEQALCKNPDHRFQSIGAMSKQAGAALDPTAVAAPAPAAPGLPGAASRQRVEPPTLVCARPNHRLVGILSMLLMAALLDLVSGSVLGTLLKLDGWPELTMVSFLACAAVLVPSIFWSGPVDESWTRRLIFMGLGLLIGLAALWLDGFQLPLPWSGGREADSLRPLAGSEPRHPILGLLYPDNRSLPVLACYLSYFGLMFVALRWWKLSEESRLQRFNVQPVLAAGFWAYILLFLLPASEQRQLGFLSMILVAVVVQLVSPWEPRSRERSKKLRLRHA